jgi:hypothetical protein
MFTYNFQSLSGDSKDYLKTVLEAGDGVSNRKNYSEPNEFNTSLKISDLLEKNVPVQLEERLLNAFESVKDHNIELYNFVFITPRAFKLLGRRRNLSDSFLDAHRVASRWAMQQFENLLQDSTSLSFVELEYPDASVVSYPNFSTFFTLILSNQKNSDFQSVLRSLLNTPSFPNLLNSFYLCALTKIFHRNSVRIECKEFPFGNRDWWAIVEPEDFGPGESLDPESNEFKARPFSEIRQIFLKAWNNEPVPAIKSLNFREPDEEIFEKSIPKNLRVEPSKVFVDEQVKPRDYLRSLNAFFAGIGNKLEALGSNYDRYSMFSLFLFACVHYDVNAPNIELLESLLEVGLEENYLVELHGDNGEPNGRFTTPKAVLYERHLLNNHLVETESKISKEGV